MQLKIYKRLNSLLTILLIMTIAFVIYVVLNMSKFGDYFFLIFLGVFVVGIIFFFIFKMIEVNYDKRLVQKMAIDGKVAIANIKNATPLMRIRDSSVKSYNLWTLEVDIYDQDLKKHSATIIEKFDLSVNAIPKGTVFVTYNPEKPNDSLIVQNVIISHIHSLMPVVSKYEKSNINIKYLSAYYKEGLVIETFKQTMKKEIENDEVSDKDDNN